MNKAALNVIYKLQPCSATYSVDNTSLASIDENGILTVLGDGNVVVTATFNGISVSRQYELQKLTTTGALVSGFYVDRAGVLKTSSGSITIKDIECVGPANLEWGTSIGKIDRLCQYDENKTFISYHETNNFTLAANARYITLSVTATSVDGIYLKDVDTGRYLWKSVIE